jgi:hypothetical protein
MGSNIPKIGTSDIVRCYLGDTEIEKVYLGSNIIYEKSVTPTEKTYTWNYQLVGSSKYQVHVEDQVISNLTYYSYIKLPNKFGVVNPNTLEAVFYFNTGDLSTWGGLDFGLSLLATGNGSSPSISMRVYKSNMYAFWNMKNTSSSFKSKSSPNNSIADNTNYKMLMNYDKSTGNAAIELYNIDKDISVYSGTISVGNAYLSSADNLIVGVSDNYPAVNGMSIDLNKSYIKVNGALIQDITENT